MKYSVISGDIVSYTSLNTTNRELISEELAGFLDKLNNQFNTYGRIIKGDYVECVVPNPGEGLEIALALKAFIKSLSLKISKENPDTPRFKLFKTYGIRLAIGYDQLSRYSPEEGVIDGEAIYLSGRTIAGKTTYDKERIIIKNTLFFASHQSNLNDQFEVMMNLLDVLLAKATARQCEILYLKLLGFTEEKIAAKLKIGQSAVNQHSTSVGWNAIESAVKYFKKVILK